MAANDCAPGRESEGAKSDAAAGNALVTKDTRTSRSWGARWCRISSRRVASMELDRLLGLTTRPDLTRTYGLRGSS